MPPIILDSFRTEKLSPRKRSKESQKSDLKKHMVRESIEYAHLKQNDSDKKRAVALADRLRDLQEKHKIDEEYKLTQPQVNIHNITRKLHSIKKQYEKLKAGQVPAKHRTMLNSPRDHQPKAKKNVKRTGTAKLKRRSVSTKRSSIPLKQPKHKMEPRVIQRQASKNSSKENEEATAAASSSNLNDGRSSRDVAMSQEQRRSRNAFIRVDAPDSPEPPTNSNLSSKRNRVIKRSTQ